MEKTKNLKTRLISSLLILAMLVSSLIGTTFAWFTDSVSSSNNKIISGSLSVDLELLDKKTGEWSSIKESHTPIFNYDNWEPGYVDAKIMRVENEGSLALKWKAMFVSEKALSELADVIDVYVRAYGVLPDATGVAYPADRSLDGYEKVGTVAQFVNTIEQTTYGNLEAGQSAYLGIALKMQETAGNEYQKKEIGAFDIQIVATQLASEEDSFGKDYDDDAKWPENVTVGNTASVNVKLNADNTLADPTDMTSDDGKISASLQAGTKMKAGATEAKLIVTDLEESKANITLNENEAKLSLDVHVEGVAEDNTTVIKVYLAEALPKGLNIGNYKLYHVDKGNTVEMTLINDSANMAHNTYEYDPATGDVVLYMATFSEVAAVAEPAKWEGNYDDSWYDADATELTIANADQLAALSAIVGGMKFAINEVEKHYTADTFSGQTIKLVADINIGDLNSENGIVFYPIGYWNNEGTYERKPVEERTTAVESGFYAFEGTFDGNGNTISNFYQNTWEMKGDHNWYDATLQYYRDGMGLFGKVYGGTVKNLTIDNFSSDGEITTTGTIAAYAEGATFENIAIFNCNPRVYNIGNGGIVGCVGWYAEKADLKTTFKNITVDNSNKISALWGTYDAACGGIVGQYYPTSGQTSAGTPKNGGIHFENCHVSAVMDVYNDVCANYQYYAYRYTGMLIGSVRENQTIDGKSYPKMDGITASGCTVHFGDWNDYYYCELVANSLASYTHDHQFSRLEQVAKVEGTTITPLKGDAFTVPSSGRYNYVVVNGEHATENATCYHFVDGKVHNHDDYNGDGVEDYETVNGESIRVENNRHIYLEFENLVTGYGWGVTSKGIGEIDGVTILDKYNNGASVVKFEKLFKNDYLYRVGNQNTVSLESLFAEIDSDQYPVIDSGVWVKVEKIDENMNVSGTFTANTTDWTKGTIKFEGTGVVKVTIQDYVYCTPTELYLEVVDAYNRTTASFGGNSVLLNDVSTSSTLSTSGVIYGNGFTVNMENAPISEKNGAVFHLYDGAVLKNLGIVGKEFTSVAMNVNDTNYGVSAVRAWGTVTIENCYISGCRSAVSVTGTELTIKDSVIANGVYANVDFRSGILNLHNVTTVNEPHTVDNTTIVGLGIVGNMTASAGRQLNITGTLTQYNWLSQADCANIKASGVDSIFESVFTEEKYADLRYTYNGTAYVNTGVLSLCSDFGASAVTGAPLNYSGMDVTATISSVTVDGYVWAPGQAGTLTDADMKYHNTVYEWMPTNQGTSYIPSAFDYSSAGLEQEGGVVQIEYESGSSYTLTADTIKKLFSATKYGQSLSCKVSMNGVDYTDKDIVFDAAASQTYTITYTITDNIVYDKDGKLTDTTYEATKELKVFATVVDKTADAPTFTFYYGTNGSASAGTPHTTQPTNSYTSTIKQIGEVYYIMPNVSATTANAIGSQTIDGETVYYSIVDGINVRSGSSSDYDFTRYYPIFKAVKISDNGTEYSYSGTKEMPATVAWESATIDSGNGASALNDGFGLYNNQYLCKIQKKAGNEESGGTSVVKFSYTALDGNAYYYYVGYRFYDESEGCVTPDTLITLADGTQVRVDSLTGNEELLVWNMETGKLDKAPIMFIDSDPAAEYEIIKLIFSDGTEVKVIYEHGFWDYDLNKYVYLDRYAEKYIGHTFAKQNGDALEKVQLVDVVIETEVTTAWSPVTAGHLCYFVNGMLSMPGGVGGLFNIFEVDAETMTYDYEAMQRDIETYGLYTYEELNAICPLSEEMFNAAGGAYLKISIGKGNLTLDELIAMINRYSKFFA